jgi:hypothetical protein
MSNGTDTTDDGHAAEWMVADLGSPTYWPTVPAWDAPDSWAELRDWVEALVDRFSLDTRAVPPCWFRHNAHVEALSALYDYERESFHPRAAAGGAVDFFRALREIEYRLIDWSSRTQCSVNEHRPDPARSWHTDDADWETFVTADAEARENRDIGQ